MKRWPNIYAQGSGWIVDCGVKDGKRDRKYFAAKSAAEAEAKARRDQRERGRLGALAISDANLMDAVAALRLLAGTGLTLEALARKELERGVKKDLLISDLYAEYLERKTAGLRPRSIDGIKSREGRFAADLAGVHLRDLSAEHIGQWISKGPANPVSRNAYLRGVRTLLNYAVRQGYTQFNPALAVDFIKTRKLNPFVFSIDQACLVLNWLIKNKPEMVAYYALGLFAGLRPDEAKLITSAQINLPDRLITVPPEVSKTHMRHVHIRENLLQWLKAYPVSDSVFWKRYHADRMTKELGLDWPNDVCRKSFISYHLAAFRNQNETVQEAGHRDSTMIFTHYRNIRTLDGLQITSDYAAGYWKITPETVRSWIEKKDSQNPEAKPETVTENPRL